MRLINRFSILAIVLVSLICSQQVGAKTFAVCVGMSDYPGTVNDLRVSANDAKTMSNLFASNGNCRVSIVTNHKATMKRVCQLMESTFKAAGSNDVIVLFFSGHGYPGGLCCYDGQLSYDKVFNVMKKSKAKSKVILADACYSGKMRDDSNSPLKGQNVLLFLSSRSNEKSLEMSNMNNSLFTHYLVQALKGKADYNRDRTITAKEVFKYVHENVISTSRDNQHPVMWGRFDDNMPIIKW